MIDTPPEWIEMAWAARDAGAGAMNAARLARFDQLKRAIGASQLPPGTVPSNATRLKAR